MKLILCLIATVVPAFALDGYDKDKVDGNTIDSLTALTESKNELFLCWRVLITESLLHINVCR